MAAKTRRSSRKCSNVGAGYYKLLNEGDQRLDTELGLNNEKLPEGIFEVERLIIKRRRKGNDEYLVLWKGHRKEETTWVKSGDITGLALERFHNPHPNDRAILDAVSSFELAIQTSLRGGILKRRITKVEFPTHVFNYLFNGKGISVVRKPGKLYSRPDFDSLYFSFDAFTYYNKHGEGVSVKFPIYMYNYVRFSLKSYSSTQTQRPQTFTETLHLKLVKYYL